VLTYNVNWGGPGADLAADVIRRSGADIVCLQETTPEWERFLRDALRREYPFAEFRYSKLRAGGGLAFLTKKRGREVAYIPSDTGWFDGWIMAFGTALGPMQVLNIHLRPPVSDNGSWVSGYINTRDDRMHELERFYNRREPNLPLLVAGDFNDGENSRAVEWLESNGLINALPQFDRNTPTWQWRVGAVTLRRRMDHILASSPLHCCSARVLKAGASDHFPVEAVFVNDGK
jgi:endonuclease/exonuclease/phosphatase family metal-dependent hydrolase